MIMKPVLCAIALAVFSASAYAVDPPSLRSPIGEAFAPKYATLSWSAVTGATWYRVWVSEQGVEGTPQLLYCDYNDKVDPLGCWVQTDTSLFAENLEVFKCYRWWVRSWNSSDGASSWSDGGRFCVAPTYVTEPTTMTVMGPFASNSISASCDVGDVVIGGQAAYIPPAIVVSEADNRSASVVTLLGVQQGWEASFYNPTASWAGGGSVRAVCFDSRPFP